LGEAAAFAFDEPFGFDRPTLDLVVVGDDPVTFLSAIAPASFTASAPSATTSPIDCITCPTCFDTPRADRFTVFTTAPAAPATGLVTPLSGLLRFLD
jgi:hypothetical protein